MGMRKTFKIYEAIIEELGAELLGTTPTGNSHFKFLIGWRGHTRKFIVPTSSSDRRSALNWRSDIRRWMTEIESE